MKKPKMSRKAILEWLKNWYLNGDGKGPNSDTEIFEGFTLEQALRLL